MEQIIMNCINFGTDYNLKELFAIKEQEYEDSCDYFNGGPQLFFINKIGLDLLSYLIDNEFDNVNEIDLEFWLFNYLNQ